MGNLRIRTLSDLARLDAHLGVRCPKCAHEAIYPRDQVIAYFHHKRWNPTLEAAGSRFRCECGHRGAELFAAVPPPVTAPPKPAPIFERDAKEAWRRRRG